MTHWTRVTRVGAVRAAVCVAALGVLAGPVAGASASDASIKSVIKSYSSKILVAEGHVVTALGEYKQSGDPTKVDAAIAKSVAVLRSLKSAIGTQSASSTKVKEGKIKVEKGLKGLIVAYEHLKIAFGEKSASPTAAKEQASKALKSLKEASGELKEGSKLLR
jgi:hypothetical protein